MRRDPYPSTHPRNGRASQFGRTCRPFADAYNSACKLIKDPAAEAAWPGAEYFMRHVISALVINEPGVLAGVAGMFSARGFNIDSLVVGRTEDPNLSRMTIVCSGDDNTIDQVRKQLAKLVPVRTVRDFKGLAYIE